MRKKCQSLFTRSAFMLLGLVFSVFISAFAEDNNGNVKGKVVTSDGKPAPDVAVILQGTKYATSTDGAGTFSFRNVPEGNYQIIVSLTGYSNITKDIRIEGTNTVNVDFQLEVSSKQLNEIVITGNQNKLVKRSSEYVSKLPLANIENPQVYTTITKDLLAQQMVYTVDDAMRNVPGITKMWGATNRSGDGGSYYNLRGFVVQSQLRNGISGNVTSTIDAANIESIEVIKGPSATLYGSAMTTYGGLINRVTKKPYDHLGGEVGYAGGSFSYNRFYADINTPLDSAKNLLFRLNTAYTDQGSFQDNGWNKSLAIAPSISYRINDRLSIALDAEFYSGKGLNNTIFFFPYTGNVNTILGGKTSADQLNIDYNRTFFNKDLAQTSRSSNFFATMNYRISDQWKSQTSVTTNNSFSDGANPYVYIAANDSLERWDQATNHSRQSVLEIQQNFIGDFKIGSLRNRFVGGLDYFFLNSDQVFVGAFYDKIPSTGTIGRYESFNREALDSLYNAGKSTSYPYVYKRSIYSAYASDVLNITDNLMVNAALRIDYYHTSGDYDKTTGTYSESFNQVALSPKFGVVYQLLQDRLSIFGNYQNGFTNKDNYDNFNKRLKPEQANQIEGGIKTDLFGGRLISTFSYYSIKVKDVVRSYVGDQPNEVFSRRTIQDGTQVSNGFEAEINATPVDGFNIIAGFFYNDSKIEKSVSDVGRRPSTASAPIGANLWLNYRILHGAAKGLGFGAGGNYVGDNKIINSDFGGVFILPAYTVINASITYDTQKLRFGVKLDNITSQKYWTGYSSMNAGIPRNFVGSVAFKF